ncbi:MAG: hypothetical protein ACREQ5_36305, partial [Candidatus Dormibacteria bacterium]
MAEGAGGDDDAGDGIAGRPVGARPRLLLFFTNADHPHRDPACATLAWLARAEGSLFECYYDSAHTGIHFGGGHPGWYDSADLRGGTVVGGRHVEALFNLLAHFRCEAALLGPTMFEAVLRDAGVTVRSAAADLPALYADLFATSTQARPSEVLVVGDGGQPQGVTLTPYAYPEIMSRRSLAMADGDWEAAAVLAPGRVVDTLWVGAERLAAWAERGFQASPVAVAPPSASVAEQTAWMAERWRREGSGFLLGDPELVARWTPTAVREGWLALYGIPQSEVIGRMAGPISGRDLVYGRQHHDQDFFLLSKLGVGFQVIDPGSPPFPVVAKVAPTWPAAPTGDIGP